MHPCNALWLLLTSTASKNCLLAWMSCVEKLRKSAKNWRRSVFKAACGRSLGVYLGCSRNPPFRLNLIQPQPTSARPNKVLVRIRKVQEGIVQGVSLSHLVPGLIYDLDPTLGGYLVSIGAAESLPSKGMALVIPLEAGEDYNRPLGGVSVTQRADAADASRRKRRTRKGNRKSH